MEISYSVLEIIQCCLMRAKEKHYLEKPIKLPCNHNACNSCLNKKLSIQTMPEIECYYPDCNKKHKIEDLKEFQINYEIDSIINENSKNLFELLRDDFKKVFDKFNEIDFEMNIDQQSEFIENDIDLRIESLKLQLDELSTCFHDKLKYHKNLAKKRLEQFNESIVDKKQEYLKLMNEIYQNSREKLHEYEKNIIKSKFEIESFTLNAPKIMFNTSQSSISEDVIGQFNNEKEIDFNKMLYDKDIPIPHKFLNRIAYSESKKQFLITDREDKSIKILTQNGSYLCEFNPNLELEYPFAIYVNNFANEIFVGDYKKQCIYVFDDDFNYITEFGHDITKAPNTITIDNLTNLLYCTDYWYDKVTIWSKDGNNYELSKEFECNSPAYIQIAQDKIFIVSATEIELDETNTKLKEIKKGLNCIFVFDKYKLNQLFEIKLSNWIEPYGLFIDSNFNIYTTASDIDEDKVLSSTAYLFKFDLNGNLLDKIEFSNYIPIDFYIIENRLLSITTESNPIRFCELKKENIKKELLLTNDD